MAGRLSMKEITYHGEARADVQKRGAPGGLRVRHHLKSHSDGTPSRHQFQRGDLAGRSPQSARGPVCGCQHDTCVWRHFSHRHRLSGASVKA